MTTEPLVRGACAWALGRYADADADRALATRRAIEMDPDVQAEIDFGLNHAIDSVEAAGRESTT